MKHILIANSKGGTGKSTLAAAIADVLDGTQIVDLDPQGSLTAAARYTDRHKPVSLDQLKGKYAIYDAPPYLSDELYAFIKRADVILVPVRLSVYDLLATGGLLKRISKKKCQDKVLVVPNAVPSKSRLTKTHEEALASILNSYKDFKKSKVYLSDLSSFRNVAEKAVWGKAKKEIQDLLKELDLN